MARTHYWSCSTFAAWLRRIGGLPQLPAAASSAEWNAYRKECQAANPRLYWLIEDGLDGLQNLICWPADKLNDIRHSLRNRFADRLHYLPTRLPAGQYQDLSTRILHGLMESLVDFVEVEKAWMTHVCDEDARQKYGYKPRRWWRPFRCPQAGIAYLEWEATLDQIEEDPDRGIYRSEQQAMTAREILTLYRWWKLERPKRPDAYDISGYSALCEKSRRGDGDLSFVEHPMSPEMGTALQKVQEIEESYDREDQEMLIRLIKIRQGLWT